MGVERIDLAQDVVFLWDGNKLLCYKKKSRVILHLLESVSLLKKNCSMVSVSQSVGFRCCEDDTPGDAVLDSTAK